MQIISFARAYFLYVKVIRINLLVFLITVFTDKPALNLSRRCSELVHDIKQLFYRFVKMREYWLYHLGLDIGRNMTVTIFNELRDTLDLLSVISNWNLMCMPVF